MPTSRTKKLKPEALN